MIVADTVPYNSHFSGKSMFSKSLLRIYEVVINASLTDFVIVYAT